MGGHSTVERHRADGAPNLSSQLATAASLEGEAADVRAQLLNRFQDVLPAFVDDVAGSFAESFESYARLRDSSHFDDVRRSVREFAAAVVAALRDRRPVGSEVLTKIERVASRRTLQGFSLPDLAGAVQLGVAAAQTRLATLSLELPPAREVTVALSGLSREVADHGIHIMTALLRGAAVRHGRNYPSKTEEAVQQLLEATWDDADCAIAVARRAGVAIDGTMALVGVAWAEVADVLSLRRRLSRLSAKLDSSTPAPPLHRNGVPCGVLLVSGVTVGRQRELEDRLGELAGEEGCFLYLSEYAEHVPALARRYDEVLQDLPLLPAAATRPRRISSTELGVLRDRQGGLTPERQARVWASLGRLFSTEDAAEWVHTLRCLAESSSIAGGARLTGFTEKGIRYRLNRIAALTNLRWSRGSDRAYFQILLADYLLNAPRFPPLGSAAWRVSAAG